MYKCIYYDLTKIMLAYDEYCNNTLRATTRLSSLLQPHYDSHVYYIVRPSHDKIHDTIQLIALL